MQNLHNNKNTQSKTSTMESGYNYNGVKQIGSLQKNMTTVSLTCSLIMINILLHIWDRKETKKNLIKRNININKTPKIITK